MFNMNLLSSICSKATPMEQEWISKRTDTLSVKERIVLDGIMKMNPPGNAKDLINILCQTDSFEVYYLINSTLELGRFVAEKIEAIDQKSMNFLDLEKLGKCFQEKHPGIFTDNGYVFMDTPVAQIYDGGNLEALPDDFAVRLKLASPQHEAGVWVKLPDYSSLNGYPDELHIALDALEAENVSCCKVLEAQCALPGIENLTDQYTDLEKLIFDANNLGYVLDEQNQGMPNFMEHFLAALKYESCRRLDFAIDISQNLDCYNFFPNEKDMEGYGRRMAQENEIIRPGSMIESAFDYAAYGEHMAQRYGVMLTERGIIGKNGNHFFYDHSSEPDTGVHDGMGFC